MQNDEMYIYELVNDIFSLLHDRRTYNVGFTYTEIVPVVKKYEQVDFSLFEELLFETEGLIVNNRYVYHDADIRNSLMRSIK